MNLPPVTLTLLIINVIISLAALFAAPRLLGQFSFKPFNVLEKNEWYRMISGAFLHGGLAHLGFNMYVLYNFGGLLEAGASGSGYPLLEEGLGPVNFLIIYFGSAITAHLLPLMKYKNDPNYSAVGASGAISGLLVAFSLAAPMWGVGLIFIPVFVPAIIFAALFIGFSWYAGRSEKIRGFGNIAHEAHLGGALGGLFLTILLFPRVIGDLKSLIEYYLG